jgi:hypothetical protein
MSSKAALPAGVTPVSDKSIGPEQLATLQIRKVIFHDVPRKAKGKEQAPTLSEVECAIDPNKIGLLKDKLKRCDWVQAPHTHWTCSPQPESPQCTKTR